jgi:hypothetical protein
VTVPAVATRTQAPETAFEDEGHEGTDERLFEPHGTTLEDAVLELWEDLVAGRDAVCPVCSGSMSMIGCSSCGSELS